MAKHPPLSHWDGLAWRDPVEGAHHFRIVGVVGSNPAAPIPFLPENPVTDMNLILFRF